MSEETGISDVVQHPRNPQVLLASAYQRRRHTGMQVAGGPEAGLYRSTDGGATWQKLTAGLPTGDVGRSGLAFSPQHPNVAYAVIAAGRGQSGFYRSADAGVSWTKMSDYVPGDPQYYMELFPDPRVFDRLYSVAIQLSVTEDGGRTWRMQARFPGVPEYAYVSDIEPSRHSVDVVHATFHHYQYGDFRPYVLRSDDRGRTWHSVAGNLPDRHVVWSIAEDHVNPNLLFAGTEFGLFVTVDGGRAWTQLGGGLPTIMVRDVALQRRAHDLVAGTFGRGIFILDDYSPLRHLTPQVLASAGTLFPVRDAILFARRGVTPGSQGHGMYAADNPPYGALLTYYVGQPGDGTVAVQVRDARGTVIAEVTGPGTRGVHRVAWNLRPQAAPGAGGGQGQASEVAPGTYSAQLVRRSGETVTPVGEVRTIVVRQLFP